MLNKVGWSGINWHNLARTTKLGNNLTFIKVSLLATFTLTKYEIRTLSYNYLTCTKVSQH